ncbi:MAG: leucine-rich repeat domain-containing protein [Muribaculaceae bacterium]|nr:leucine-rich repeat domain-containing protein [Muribaculaceae bacterium]
MEQKTTPLPDHGIFTYADKDSTRHVSAGRLRAWLTQGPDERIEALERRLDTLLETDDSSAIDNFREILRFLEGLTDDERLAARLADIQSRLDGLDTRVDANEVAIADAPELAFRELWRSAGCSVDEAAEPSEMYVCNGLGMSCAEARAVYAAGVMTNDNRTNLYATCDIRTHLPHRIHTGVTTCNYTFRNSKVEVVSATLLVPGTDCFRWCSKLRKVTLYSPNVSSTASTTTFEGCSALESIVVYGTVYARSFSLADSPLISLASLQGIIGKTQADSAAMAITVHPDVYAKLTGDTSNPAAAALAEEELAKWMQLPLDVADKNINITFTTKD